MVRGADAVWRALDHRSAWLTHGPGASAFGPFVYGAFRPVEAQGMEFVALFIGLLFAVIALGFLGEALVTALIDRKTARTPDYLEW